MTASELVIATDRFRSLAQPLLGFEPDARWMDIQMDGPGSIPAGANISQKMMGRFQDVRDLVDEARVLSKSVARLDEKQSVQNVSAIHGGCFALTWAWVFPLDLGLVLTTSRIVSISSIPPHTRL